MKKTISAILCAAMVFATSSCGSLSNLANGTLIGTGAGAAVGAGVGAAISKDGKGAAIGAAIGTALGAGVGAIIGKKMDQKAEQLAAIEGAQVETITDANNLQAVKVTFDNGILFDFNSSTLKPASKEALAKFASTMADMSDTDLTILGHTDNVGKREANDKVSLQRADAVAKYLKSLGMSADRFTVKGVADDQPVASNDTAEGRAQNRRVEVYITANEKMIADAESQN